MLGAVEVVLLLVSLSQWQQSGWMCVIVDIALPLNGIVLSLSAANTFGHRRVQTQQGSGTLQRHHTVTRAEMIEHAYYHGINLAQILFLHAQAAFACPMTRTLLAIASSLPWAWRDRVPKHSFRDNYKDKVRRQCALWMCLTNTCSHFSEQ